MVNGNRFPGLHRGPIEHEGSSVLNMISGGATNASLTMGSVVKLVTPVPTTDILPRVEEASGQGTKSYGIVVFLYCWQV